ncbi:MULTISPECIES: hypothetical protein [Bacillus]|uniref:hypothetical protein n=1 Tax=Bacillaceae TaxID=186817 RepID=UPI0007B073B5|nr:MULTISPECIES: hypothetical protein [Bacillus]KZN99988.1 hypothetical protein A4244_03555 [Bacillus badius]OCS86153.1 hypothetical protein A6M11_03555 [Bacillus badius]OVE52386.1 hypothetical protein B1A98_08330 [Bacillus badius]TDW04121.1 hypothetical protein B0G66_103422 [Bacillus badius]
MNSVNLTGDRNWDTMMHLFLEHPKLSKYLDCVDQENGYIEKEKLKKLSAPWSTSEKFVLDFALHLYDADHHVNLHQIDYLDVHNRALIFGAFGYRFQCRHLSS